jgi:hypothetical protein
MSDRIQAVTPLYRVGAALFLRLRFSRDITQQREMNKNPERPRKNFNAYDRPIEWYRLPFAIKLAVLNLWRAEQGDFPPFVSDTAADEYSTNPGTEALLGVGKPTHADRRAPQFGGMIKVVVVMLCVVAIGIAVYFLNTLAPIATAPAPAP